MNTFKKDIKNVNKKLYLCSGFFFRKVPPLKRRVVLKVHTYADIVCTYASLNVDQFAAEYTLSCKPL